jgi:NAD(P)-dependent dehydrogenase (short-subunit alcohol dehydrogenase family)
MPDPHHPFGDLRGRVAVVTGGNGGIGLSMATGIARSGAAVAVWGRSEAKNAAAVESLRAEGVDAAAFVCDVGDETAVDAAMAATLERFGKVDALVANAGVAGGETRFVDMTLEEWQALMRIDVDGAFLTLRAGARHMVTRGEGGALVAVSSVVSRFGAARKAHYGAAKPAVEGLVRALAVELAPARIRVNALAPGWSDTAMIQPGGSFGSKDHDRFRAATIARTPARRWAEPADFHAVAAYLADPSIVFHTGDIVTLDGGYSIA